MLIGIAGNGAGCGKDTVASFLCAKKDYHCIPFALSIKKMLTALTGWELWKWQDRHWKESIDPAIGHSPRQLAQTLGTEWRDVIGNKFLWCNALERYADTVGLGTLNQVCIPDVRFAHEQHWIKDRGGQIWYVNRPDLKKIEGNHASENSLDMNLIDARFENDSSILELYNRVRKYCEENGIK